MINKSLNYILNNVISFFEMVKSTESKNPKIEKTKIEKIMLLWKCAACDSKASNFIKEQEATGLLSKLTGIKAPILRDLPMTNILF